ncbi:MAG: hypothetical protein WA099_10480 [Sulfuricurvum sp.]
MKKNLYIHIGLPKTGTSAIQKFFVDNDEKLKNEYDLYYPDFGRWSDGSHHEIAFALSPNPYTVMKNYEDQMLYLDQLGKNIATSNCNNIVLSSECFHLYDNQNFINKFGKSYNIKIISYLRRQDEFLESIYKQEIQDCTYKEKRKFDEYKNAKKDDLFYFSFLKRWEILANTENIILKTFDIDRLVNQNIIDDFLDIFSIDCKKSDFKIVKDKVNVSFTRNVTEYKLLLNSVLVNQNYELVIILHQYSQAEMLNGDITVDSSFFDSETRKNFLIQYQEDNNKILNTYNIEATTLFSNSIKIERHRYSGLSYEKIFSMTKFIYSKNKKIVAQIYENCLNNTDTNENVLRAIEFLYPISKLILSEK